MKSLIHFINEYKGHAAHDGNRSVGDPDMIKHLFAQGWVKLKFNKDNAYPYVYNKKLNKIIIGESGTIHNNIFTTKYLDQLKELGLEKVESIKEIRYCCGLDDDTNEIDKWYEQNKKYVDNTICGRIWYNAQDDFQTWEPQYKDNMEAILDPVNDLDSTKCYVAHWNEVEPNEFKTVTDNIVKLFAKHINKQIKSYIGIDNNGEPIELIVDKGNVKVDKRSKEFEKEIDYAWQYHTDNTEHGRKRKHDLIKGYIKSRDEHFQKTRYNHTNSKTAAEFHNKFTKRYDTKSGKYVWGEKIGDSLQMKTITNYITEHILNKHLHKSDLRNVYAYNRDYSSKPVYIMELKSNLEMKTLANKFKGNIKDELLSLYDSYPETFKNIIYIGFKEKNSTIVLDAIMKSAIIKNDKLIKGELVGQIPYESFSIETWQKNKWL